jgi:hypothetical protein
MRSKTNESGASYHYGGPEDEAAREYERFRGCLLQLTDEGTDVGNVEGRWVIFQSGWVYGLSSYKSEQDAIAFARQIFRDEPEASYIIVQVDTDKHALTAMHLLASALSDVESNARKGLKDVHPEVPVEGTDEVANDGDA